MADLNLTSEDLAVLSAWMIRQRWYGEKSRQLTNLDVEVVSIIDLDDGRCALLVGRCSFGEGLDSTYLLPVRLAKNTEERVFEDDVADAFLSASFLAWLAEGFPQQRRLQTPSGLELVWSGGDAFPEIVGDCRLLGAEQSNTSVLFGRQAIGKVFRKLQPGVNPDPEIVGFLTRQNQFGNVPKLLGTIEAYTPGQAEAVTIAAVQSFVPNQGDCWSWLLTKLPELTSEGADRLTSDIRLLGQRTGELHAALANGADDEHFASVDFNADDALSMESALSTELSSTTAMIRRSGVRSEDRLAALEHNLTQRISGVGTLVGYRRIRVHGDYHLGQVLKTADDFIIIDFEGEPSRSIEARRQKASPLKDVAGMLRSIDYAVSSVELRLDRPTDDIEFREWGRIARWAFITGYLSAIEKLGRPLIPLPGSGFEIALAAFIIEKALYEVRYELDNRPDWVEIPLRAVEEIYA